MIRKMYFKGGYLEGDDDLTSLKGHRSDVLVEDFHGFFYELNFITPERVKSDLETNLLMGKCCFTDVGLVFIAEVKKSNIIEVIKELDANGFFSSQKNIEIEVDENWYCEELN